MPIDGVLTQEQNGIEKPIIFISHLVGSSDDMGYHGARDVAFVFCVKKPIPYLMGKLFTVKTGHKNLVYLANSSHLSDPKVRRVLLSEIRFLIQHIPGVQSVVVDRLTRHFREWKLPRHVRGGTYPSHFSVRRER